MAITINTNIASLSAQRGLNKSQSALQNTMQRLSSGLRINSAKDDAAGLAIGNRMGAQIRGMNQAIRNANDGISMAQTAEGALQESTNILQRMRELAVQGASDTNSTADRTAITNEMGVLASELTRIADSTEFNGRQILGASTKITIQVGANTGSDQQISVSVGKGATAASGFTAAGLSVSSLSVSSAGAASAAITAIDNALSTIDTKRADLGAVQNRMESTISNLQNVSENLSSARSRVMDADIASETSAMTKNNILQQAGVAILAQANQAPSLALSLLG